MRLRGSRPVVGSSRKSTGGAATRLAARSSRRRMPPGERPHQAVGGVGEAQALEQLVGPRADDGPRQVVEAADHLEVGARA